MFNTDKYLNIKYKRDCSDRVFCDCWGLVCLIYNQEFNINIPDYRDINNIEETTKNKKFRCWSKVQKPESPGIVLMSLNKEELDHVGFITNEKLFFHISKQTKSPILSRFSDFFYKDKIRGFYIYEP